MVIDWNDNKLTYYEIDKQLIQGSKVEFMWYGNNELKYIGRIELDKHGRKFFVPERFYNEDSFLFESMQYYNPLKDFFYFTEFKILTDV